MIKRVMGACMAIGFDNIIGDKDGKLPWKNKDDMTFFKNYTRYKDNPSDHMPAIIMGRKTFEVVGALPDRDQIIICRPENESELREKVNELNKKSRNYLRIVTDIEVIKQEARTQWIQKRYTVVGGPKTILLFLDSISQIYITHIHRDDILGDNDTIYTFVDEIFLQRLKHEFEFKNATNFVAHGLSTTKTIMVSYGSAKSDDMTYPEYPGMKKLSEKSRLKDKIPNYAAPTDFGANMICEKVANNKIILYLGDHGFYDNQNILGYLTMDKILGNFQPLFDMFTMCTSVFCTETLLDGYDVEVIYPDDSTMRLSEMFEFKNRITDKDIRFTHNVEKIMRARSFEFDGYNEEEENATT